MKSKRIEEIETYIYEHKTVTLEQLCKNFNVSMNTIRRDIKELTRDGNIKKIYGGVTVKSSIKELLPFSERHISNLEEKQKIAARAAELVEDGDVIFIDSGTTTFHMVDHLKDKKNLTVLTNNFEVLIRAVMYENSKLISLSGEFNRKTLSFVGDTAAEVLSNYNISKAFMAATGISIEGGATNSSNAEYNIKNTAVKKSKQVYLLTDHNKFDVVALLTYCQLDQITGVISDRAPSRELLTYLANNDAKLILA